MRRLMREITELKNSPPEGIRISTSEDNMLDVTGIIEGPGECAIVLRRRWLTCCRGYALRWWIFPSQVQVH
jgi:hypothetical protein